MTSLTQAYFTGNLFAWHRRLPDYRNLTSLAVKPMDVAGWSHLTLRSSKALLPDDQPNVTSYEYSFVLRESKERFLLLASRSELVDGMLKQLGEGESALSPSIDVSRLTSDLSKRPGSYSLGALFARVEGYGHSVRSIALYGSDLAEARLFTDLLPQLLPYRVHLRDVRTGLELLSVGSKGEVAFFYRGVQSLRDVDTTLAFLTRSGYITWSLASSSDAFAEES